MRAVLFDLFGTLARGLAPSEHRRVLDQMADSLRVDPEAFAEIWRSSVRHRHTGRSRTLEAYLAWMCRSLHAPVDVEDLAVAGALRRGALLAALEPRCDAVAVIRALRDREYRVAVVTNCGPEVPPMWPTISLADAVDVVVFSCKVGAMKPDRGIYELALGRCGSTAAGSIFVGDGASAELTGARKAGLQPVLLTTPATHGEHPAARPDPRSLVITALPALLRFVDR